MNEENQYIGDEHGVKAIEESVSYSKLAQPEGNDLPFKCSYAGCSAAFATQQALRMHTVRMHTHRTKSQWHRKLATRKDTNEKQRQYNAAFRARNIAKGLTGAGKPRKLRAYPSSKPKAKRSYYEIQRDRFYALGLNAKGKPLKSSPAEILAIRQAQARRRAREAKERKQQHYVWPLPTEQPATLDAPTGIKHCPYCGHNIEKHL